MRFKVGICLLLFWLISGKDAEGSVIINEQGKLNSISDWNLSILIHLLTIHFPNIDTTNIITSMQFLFPKTTDFKILNAAETTFNTKDNSLTFHYKKTAFQFKLNFYWIFSLLVFPISGRAEALIKVEDLTYSLVFKDKTITPILKNATWIFEDLSISDNLIAKLLNFGSIIRNSLETQWKAKVIPFVETTCLSKLPDYFKIKFPEIYNVVVSYLDSKHTIQIQLQLAKYIVKNSSLEYSYSEKTTESIKTHSYTDNKKYAISYALSNDLITKIFKEFQNTISALEITNETIPAECPFRLNSKQLAQVLPDYYIRNGNIEINSIVSGLPSKPKLTKQPDNILKIEGLLYNISFLNKKDTLVTGEIEVTLWVVPSLYIGTASTSAFLRPVINDVKTNIISIKQGKGGMAIKHGFADYVQYGLESWISEYYKDYVFGNGIYLEFNYELDNKKSFTELTDEGIISTLYTLDQ